MKHPLFALAAPDGGGVSSIDAAIDAIGTAPVVAPTPTPVATPPSEVQAPAAETKPEPAAHSEPTQVDDPFSALRSKTKTPTVSSSAPEVDDDGIPKGPKQLREAFKLTKAELATERKLKEELRVALAEGTKKEVDAARAAIAKERDEIKSKHDALESKLRLLDYKQSDDYATRFDAPIKSAWENAKTTMAELRVDDGNGGRRAATVNDLVRITQMDGADAREEARRVFGDDAGDVLAIRRNILGLYKAADDAVGEWKTKGSEFQDRTRAEEVEFNGKLNSEFDQHLNRVRNEMPDIYDYDQKDEEAKKYVEESEKFIQIAFRGKGMPEGLSPAEQKRRIALNQAEVAARARAWAPQVLRAKRAEEKYEAQIEALKSELAELKGTEPGPGGKQVPAAANGAKKQGDWASAIDALPSSGRR